MIALDANSRDRLDCQLRRWREEVRVHGESGTGQSTMTQEDVDQLESRIAQLYRSIALLNQEYRSIIEL